MCCSRQKSLFWETNRKKSEKTKDLLKIISVVISRIIELIDFSKIVITFTETKISLKEKPYAAAFIRETENKCSFTSALEGTEIEKNVQEKCKKRHYNFQPRNLFSFFFVSE